MPTTSAVARSHSVPDSSGNSQVGSALQGRIRRDFAARLGDGELEKLKWRDDMVVGIRLVELPLQQNPRPGAPLYTAVIPGGPLVPGSSGPVKNASQYYLKRSTARGDVKYAGPFQLSTGTTKIDLADAGKTVKVTRGKDIVVLLPGSGSTAYTWRVGQSPKSMGQPSYAYKLDQPVMAGTGGSAQFSWRTADLPDSALGRHKLRFEFAFERKVTSTFEVTVDVQG